MEDLWHQRHRRAKPQAPRYQLSKPLAQNRGCSAKQSGHFPLQEKLLKRARLGTSVSHKWHRRRCVLIIANGNPSVQLSEGALLAGRLGSLLLARDLQGRISRLAGAGSEQSSMELCHSCTCLAKLRRHAAVGHFDPSLPTGSTRQSKATIRRK